MVRTWITCWRYCGSLSWRMQFQWPPVARKVYTVTHPSICIFASVFCLLTRYPFADSSWSRFLPWSCTLLSLICSHWSWSQSLCPTWRFFAPPVLPSYSVLPFWLYIVYCIIGLLVRFPVTELLFPFFSPHLSCILFACWMSKVGPVFRLFY